MKIDAHKLDNPVWNSLNETHKRFSLDYDGIKFYKPAYCPFGGFVKNANTTQGINEYASLINSFYVVGDKPQFSTSVSLNKNLVGHQMLLENPIDIEVNEPIFALTTKQHKSDLFNLVNLVQPGYFNIKTSDLGRYFGIYKNDNLVAVTGERMEMNTYTEVSAVVTHPEHTGKGYAKQLITHASKQIFHENKIPYLHVAASNIAAIKLYEKLGFTIRRNISFWHFKTI